MMCTFVGGASDLNDHRLAFARCNTVVGRLCCLGLSAPAIALSSISMPGHVLGICQPETPETAEGKLLEHAMPPHLVKCNA